MGIRRRLAARRGETRNILSIPPVYVKRLSRLRRGNLALIAIVIASLFGQSLILWQKALRLAAQNDVVIVVINVVFIDVTNEEER